jgi:glycolate oxidase
VSTQEEFVLKATTAGLTPDEIITDPEELTFLGTDVYQSGDAPTVAVRPRNVESLAMAVRIGAAAGFAIVPRGGGASYTDGYLTRGLSVVLIDTRDLGGIDVHETNATVTVEAGVTWANLKAHLDSLGWRTPFWGPFSGIAATVGGSVSQHAVSHGSGGYGISANSVHSLDVVLANGELLTTGAAAGGGALGVRHQGPDLTGLFTGDCGAFGVKARITLPLLRRKAAFQAASFAFESFESFHTAMRHAAREGLDDENFGLDAALSQGQIAREENANRTGEVVATVIRTHGLIGGIRQLVKMGIRGTHSLAKAQYAAHYILEGTDEAEAKAKLKRLRQIIGEYGVEMVNTVPTVVRGMPFAPLFNTLGPNGERWVPLHGVLSHEATQEFNPALTRFFSSRKLEMERLGIWSGQMFTAIGSSGFLYELALYWPDCRTVYHEREIDAAYLENLPRYDPNPDARAYVAQLKSDLIQLYVDHGASFFQLGRAYPFASRLNEPALQLLQSIKELVDERSALNPGVLGLGDRTAI